MDVNRVESVFFRMKGMFLEKEISPGNIPLPLLNDLLGQMTTFIKGAKRINLDQIKVSISEGSLLLRAEERVDVIGEVVKDLHKVAQGSSLDDIDPRRAQVFQQLQKLASENEGVSYEIFKGDIAHKTDAVVVTSGTRFKIKKNIWVNVELYVRGWINDLGGKREPNVHLELEDGSTLKIGSEKELLASEKVNRLYKHQLVRIRAERNVSTGQLREQRLVSFENYRPEFDEDQFQKVVRKARVAWKDVSNAADWVEEARGSNGQ